MRVLAFGAHPDDLEFQMGGTLAKYAKQGHEVYMAVATNGCIGSYSHTREEIAAIRHKEAQNAADMIGAKLLWLDFEDEFLFDNKESRLKFIDAIRIARPDVMFSHEPYNDYNQDHDITGYLAFTARILSVVKLIETGHETCAKVPAYFYYTTLAIMNFISEYYVDITDTFEMKQKLFLCHDSQQGDWCRDAFGVSYMEMMESESKLLATQAGTPGCSYAEGFKLCKSWPAIAGAYKLLPQ
jgi:LmbE family N-acetylglucosaminyl deacetylase